MNRLHGDMKELERATPRPQLRARILASLPDPLPTTPGPQAVVWRTVPGQLQPAVATWLRKPRYALGAAFFALTACMVFAAPLLRGHRRAGETYGKATGLQAAVQAPVRNQTARVAPDRSVVLPGSTGSTGSIQVDQSSRGGRSPDVSSWNVVPPVGGAATTPSSVPDRGSPQPSAQGMGSEPSVGLALATNDVAKATRVVEARLHRLGGSVLRRIPAVEPAAESAAGSVDGRAPGRSPASPIDWRRPSEGVVLLCSAKLTRTRSLERTLRRLGALNRFDPSLRDAAPNIPTIQPLASPDAGVAPAAAPDPSKPALREGPDRSPALPAPETVTVALWVHRPASVKTTPPGPGSELPH